MSTKTKCPQCKGDTDPTTGCKKCEIFQCADCEQWVAWGLGGEDNDGLDDEGRPLCDACWDGQQDNGLEP